MALRTSGVGAERKLEFWDQYGVEKVNATYKGVLLPDVDTTPVGDVLLKVLDEKLKLRNAADDANVILDEVFIPHTLTSEFTFTNLVKFARPANEPSVRIGDAGQGYQILQFSKRTAGGGIANLEVEDEASLLVLSAGLATAAWSPTIGLGGIDEGSAYAGCIYLRSAKSLAGGTDYNIERLKVGVGAIADATWAAILQSGLKLKDALNANSQKITNLLDPTAAQDGATKAYVDSVITGLDWQESVLDKDLNTPPGAPTAGDRYIVAAVAAGLWAGHEDEIAEWDGAAWVFAAPSEGFACEVEDEDLAYVYDGAAWVLFGSIIAYGDDVFATFGGVGRLGWDTTDIDANLLKVELPTGGGVDVPVLVAGIGIVGVDLGFFDGLTEPVAALVDIAQTSWVTFGFGAAATPELNCGGVATAIRLGVPFDMNGNKIGGLDAPVAQDDALRKQRAEIIETDVDVTEIEVLSHKDVASGYCPLDASVLVPLANIPTPLTGKDADTLDSIEGADLIKKDGTVAFTGPIPAGAAGALTIATGAIAVTKSFHKVDTEAGGATDDLDSITGGAEGDIVVLKAADGTHTVVCKHGTGNLRLDGSADFSLDNADDSITLIYDGANWLELARSNNGA